MPAQPWHDSPFMRACRREAVPYTPVWIMRQAGRYQPSFRALRERVRFLDLCKSPDLVAEVTTRAVEETGVDAAIIFSDILVPLEPIGIAIDFIDGERPHVPQPIRSAADVDQLHPGDLNELEYTYEGIRRTRAALPADMPLIGFCGAPFTLACYCIEGGGSTLYERAKQLMYDDSATWHRLLDALVQILIPHCRAQVDAGAGAIQVFDSHVGVLSPADYREYVLPHTRALFAGIADAAPTIHFGTDTATLLESQAEAGGDVIGLDWRIDLAEGWRRVGDRAVQGNLDPMVLLSSQANIRRQTQRILDSAAGRPGHIFNLGHGIHATTPIESVRAFVDAVHELSGR